MSTFLRDVVSRAWYAAQLCAAPHAARSLRRTGLVAVRAGVFVAVTALLLLPPPASARVMPPDTRLIEALQAARPSFERCALDSGLAETAFHTLSLRIQTDGYRVSRVVWSQPFVGPRVAPLLACMRTIVRVALRPRRLHARPSVSFYYRPLPDLDFPMQPAPAAPSRVMSEAEAEQLRAELAALPDDTARLARLVAQEETRVAVPISAVAAIEAAFRAPDLRVGGALCRVVSGPRALARVTRGLPGLDARRLRALTRGRCGVTVE